MNKKDIIAILILGALGSVLDNEDLECFMMSNEQKQQI